MEPLPRVVTRWTTADVLAAYAAAWRRVVGGEPSRAALALLWGWASIECGRDGRACYCHNLGNIRAGESQPHYLLPGAYEFALPGAVPAGATVIPIPAGSAPPSHAHVAYLLPARVQRFRAFASFVDAAVAKLELTLRSWPRAVAALRTATGPEAARAMIAGLLVPPAYLTGDYGNSIESLAAECLRRTPEHDWPTAPSPSSAHVTQPQTPTSKSAPRMAAVRPSTPPPVHLPAPRGGVLRGNPWGHAYALTEAPPATDALSVIRWLAVERSPRYRPQPGVTFCNIYAADTARAMGAYLPRVFWLEPAVAAFARGETREPSIEAPATVGELSANALFRWLVRWGSTYGWERLTNLDDAQDAANAGRCVVLCARRTDERQPGHIGLVAPESDACRALRGESGAVLLPVQSMAGSTLLELGHGKAWWRGAEFAEWGAWANSSGSPNSSPGVADGRTQPLWETVEGEHTVAPEEPEL